jgi:hypothetical protein
LGSLILPRQCIPGARDRFEGIKPKAVMTFSRALRSFMAASSRKLTAAFFAMILLAAGGFSPAFAQAPAGCEPRPDPQKLDATRPLNVGQLKLQLVYYRCTRYDTEVAAVLRKARGWVERQAAHVMKPALVLDIDETSLSNWKQLHQNDFGFIVQGNCDFSKGSACGQIAWEKSESAEPIMPTLELFNAAVARKVTVFFITGRRESPDERAATEANLRKAGYEGWQHLYMRTPDFDGPSVAPFKTSARKDIESQGYAILANVGDQQSDLADGHAKRRFKVPNPFYFIR